MPTIFLDESGDLGFDFTKPKTSKFFVITCVFVDKKRPIEKIPRRIMKSFTEKERKRHNGCLHAHKETPRTRLKVLNELANKDVTIVSIYLNKQKVYTSLQDQKHALYNFVTNILLDRVYRGKLVSDKDTQIELIASRRETNKLLNDGFASYVRNKLRDNHRASISVTIKTPNQEKGLQVADCACWAIFRNREHGDDTYYNVIKSLVQEAPLFP